VKLRAALLVSMAAIALTVPAGAAAAKPGPPGSIAEGHIQADLARRPCLTTRAEPGGYVYLAPCTSKHNAEQRWKILKVGQVIIVGLAAHPGTCLGAVPKTVKIKGKAFHFAVTYDCGRNIETKEGLLLGVLHHASNWHTIRQAHGGRLLSAPRAGSNRTARWLHSDRNIPQTWLLPPFKRITP